MLIHTFNFQVVMHFKKKFWAPKMHGVRLFTSLTILNDSECPFHIIHDVSMDCVWVIYQLEELEHFFHFVQRHRCRWLILFFSL